MPASNDDYAYYEMMADGFFTAAACAIILAGRDVRLLSIFTGPLFLTASAFAMLLTNKTIFRIYMKIWIILGKVDNLTGGEFDKTTVKSRFVFLKSMIKDSFKNSFYEDNEQYASTLKKVSGRHRQKEINTVMHIDIKEMLLFFFVFSGWPLMIVVFYEKIRLYFG